MFVLTSIIYDISLPNQTRIYPSLGSSRDQLLMRGRINQESIVSGAGL